MTSPLHPDALSVEELKRGMRAEGGIRVTTIRFLEDGSFDPSVEYRDFFTQQVQDVGYTAFTGEPILGSKKSETFDFVRYGLKPDADGKWSTEYCVVTHEVAKRLGAQWRHDHRTPVQRGPLPPLAEPVNLPKSRFLPSRAHA